MEKSIDSAWPVVGIRHGVGRRWLCRRWRRRKDVAWAGYVIMIRWRSDGHGSSVFATKMGR